MSADRKILTKLTEEVSQITNNTLSTFGIQAVSLELSDFWTDDPEIWFLRAEAQFRAKFITVDQTTFGYVITPLGNRAAAEVKAVFLKHQSKENIML